MIDVSDEDIVLERRTGDGRFVLFTRTDLPTPWTLPWRSVVASTGGGGHGFMVRLDDRHGGDGWSAADLLEVAVARAMAEQWRRPGPLADDALRHLAAIRDGDASRLGRERGEWRVTFRPGPAPSPFEWCIARIGPFELPLCPDPEGREEGLTLEQIAIVLHELFVDATLALPRERWLGGARRHAAAALAAETRRLAVVRAEADAKGKARPPV
jgi:hypothetical protein